MPQGESVGWRFIRFGLLVTGKGEERFLPRFFRSLMESGDCTVQVIRRIPQVSPVLSEKRHLRMAGQGKKIPNRDQEAGLAARVYLQRFDDSYVVLVDDLEGDRAGIVAEVYARYRTLLDVMLDPVHLKHRAAVHFLVNMLEAYYFADARAVNAVMGTQFEDHDGDVETIPHPKNELKRRIPGFDEVLHGERIVGRLDVRHVLSRPETCASLRTLFAWCVRALRCPFSDEYQLLQGRRSPVTEAQLDAVD